ncbi:MAG TPA: VOC family protein [Methylomirabilota bacterium]
MGTSDAFFQSLGLVDFQLRVRDLERVRRFYREVLGFREISAAPGRVAFSASGDPPALVTLEHAPDARQAPTGSAGLFHVAFLYPDRAALGRALERVSAVGLRLGGADHGVSEAVYLSDPEGNGIELYADRPAREWPPGGAEGDVAMVTDPLDFAGVLAAGRRTREAGMPPDVRVGHVHLRVSDLDRTDAFYTGLLGFAVRQRDYPGARFFGRDGYHHHLGANVWHSRRPAAAGALGLARFTLRFADAASFAPLARALRDAGLVVAGNATWVETRDPDGIPLVVRT